MLAVCVTAGYPLDELADAWGERVETLEAWAAV